MYTARSRPDNGDIRITDGRITEVQLYIEISTIFRSFLHPSTHTKLQTATCMNYTKMVICKSINIHK